MNKKFSFALASIANKPRLVGLLLALLFLGIAVPQIKVKANSWNDYSHAAAIESLVARGTWVINGSRWTEDTGDKIKIGRRFYSDKLPLLSFVGAQLYSALHRVGNVWLTPDCHETGQACAYPWLVFFLVTLPAAFLIWLFYDWQLRNGIAIWVAVLCAGALAFGTMILPYALVLNHHVPAAVALFTSFWLLYVARENSTRAQVILFGAGFFGGLGAALDISSSVWWLGLAAIALYRFRAHAILFLGGALIPFLATALLDYQMLGTIVPPSFIPDAYNYPEAQFPNTFGGIEAPENIPQYAFDMLLGARGLYMYHPILIFALIGLVTVARRRSNRLWFEAVAVAFCFALVTWLLVSRTNHFGGVAYGERLYIPSLPLVFAFVAFGVPFIKTRGQNIWRVVFALALGVSVLSVSQGAAQPWGKIVPPPFEIKIDAEFPWMSAQWNFGVISAEAP